MQNKHLKPFIPLVSAIADTFGKNCEVVLHDLSSPEVSIIAIANGHVTGRTVGSPITDLGLRLIKNAKDNALVGYRTKTKDGAELKSTTVFIRDAKDKVIGCLCVNIDITLYLALKNLMDDLSEPMASITTEGEYESPEKFESGVDSLLQQLLSQSIKKTNKPLAYMSKDEKLAMIRDLKEKGFFLIKGSTKRLSVELNVSLATVYKYLEEI